VCLERRELSAQNVSIEAHLTIAKDHLMHMLRTFGLCSALSIALLSGQASADSANHATQAERFLELVNADRLSVPVYGQVQQMFAQRFEQTRAPESKRALLEQYQSKADAALDKAIGWEKVKPDLIKLYTDTFTEQELTQLNDFYESALGKKMLTKLPELNARSAQVTQAKLESAVPQVNKLLAEMTAELDTQKKP
tara:strand:+ start:4147 stop:4734 length:588 start_codon:yes stop_codon:yes gene_type:complete